MEKEKLNLNWFVFKENINRNTIEIYDIFDHVGFRSECENLLETYYNNSKSNPALTEEYLNELEQKIIGIIQYYFWSKAEYEILCTSHIMPEKCATAKVSIYDQVMLNFRAFYYYIISIFLSSDYTEDNNE